MAVWVPSGGSACPSWWLLPQQLMVPSVRNAQTMYQLTVMALYRVSGISACLSVLSPQQPMVASVRSAQVCQAPAVMVV